MKFKIKTNSKKAAMGPWPTIIGGVIVCAIFFYIITYITSGGLAQSRELINKAAYSNFKSLAAESWNDGTSITTNWKMAGASGEAWALMFLDRDNARILNQMAMCKSGQTDGLCVTSRTKSVINKCTRTASDLCFCLVKFNTGKFSVHNAVAIESGASLDETLQNIKNWNTNKLFPLLDHPVDFVACDLIMSEMNCMTYFNTPCIFKTTNEKILVWVGTDDLTSVNYQVLQSTKTIRSYDATFVVLNGTILGGGHGGNDIFLGTLSMDTRPWK